MHHAHAHCQHLVLQASRSGSSRQTNRHILGSLEREVRLANICWLIAQPPHAHPMNHTRDMTAPLQPTCSAASAFAAGHVSPSPSTPRAAAAEAYTTSTQHITAHHQHSMLPMQAIASTHNSHKQHYLTRLCSRPCVPQPSSTSSSS
jgi:hypothetical protein